MANPYNNTIIAPGTYVFLPDYRMVPFNLSNTVVVPGGTTASFLMNYTLVDPNFNPGNGYTPPPVVWLPTLAFPSGTTATTSWPMTSPVCGLQLVVASISGGPIYWNCIHGDFVGT